MPSERDILTGKTEAHVEPFEGGVPIHSDMKEAFILLRERAKEDGIHLQIVSGFRGFDAQLRIWNLKAQGKRDLLDKQGNKLDYTKLSAEEIVYAILRWSALPGASRHHWGTDIDLIDGAAVPEGYKIQLVPAEAAPGGPFEKLSKWLSKNMKQDGFFRPYERDMGGISPEWWHLSYAPLSKGYYQAQTLSIVEEVIREAEIEKKDVILRKMKFIYENYVRNICAMTVMCFFLATPAFGAKGKFKDDQMIRDVHSSLWEAWNKKDGKALKTHFADDFSFIGPEAINLKEPAGTKATGENVTIQFVHRNIAVVDQKVEIGEQKHQVTSVVGKKSGKWWLRALRVGAPAQEPRP